MLPPPLAAACRSELVISLEFQLQSAAHRTLELFGAAMPRTSARSLSTRSHAPRSSPGLASRPFPFWVSAHAALGNLDKGQPFSYFYESQTQHRLESVATRTPPPICTSAQGSQTALVWKTVERRERSNNYTMAGF